MERKRLGRYLIEAELGKGGMGTVYRARDERLGKTVAVKFLSEAKSISADSRRRFRLEARAAAILNHPSIAAVFDYDEDQGTPFIVYEYAHGRRLDSIIAEGNLTEAAIVDIASQLASALEYAHDRGILHRDVKPQNIILTDEGRVKLLDFGLAKRIKAAIESPAGSLTESVQEGTVAGTIIGTAQYMSPEQLAGETLDGRTDIFSLGILLFEMATGKNPFQGETFASVVGRIMSPESPSFRMSKLRVSPELQEIILRCLQKKREERYQGARMLLTDLDGLQRRPARPRAPAVAPTSIISRRTARACLILLQALYLAVYGVALMYHLGVLGALAGLMLSIPGIRALLDVASPVLWTTALLTTACAGIAARLFLVVSVGFDDPETGRQFRRLFPFLFALDELWALSPLLLLDRWPAGIALVAMAILAYLPMSQRTLIRSAYQY